jgi:hypothetical protein
MAVQDYQQTLATKAGITLAAAKQLSGADLLQAAIHNQAGTSVAQKKGTTEVLASSLAARTI